jgi:hypothetical protein
LKARSAVKFFKEESSPAASGKFDGLLLRQGIALFEKRRCRARTPKRPVGRLLEV